MIDDFEDRFLKNLENKVTETKEQKLQERYLQFWQDVFIKAMSMPEIYGVDGARRYANDALASLKEVKLSFD